MRRFRTVVFCGGFLLVWTLKMITFCMIWHFIIVPYTNKCTKHIYIRYITVSEKSTKQKFGNQVVSLHETHV